MAGRNHIINLDLAMNNDLSSPDGGYLRFKAKPDEKFYVVTPSGVEKEVNTGAPQTVTKLVIDGGAPDTVPENFVLRFDFGGVE